MVEDAGGPRGGPARVRAAFWYRAALPGLSDIDLIRVEKRLEELPSASGERPRAKERRTSPPRKRRGGALGEAIDGGVQWLVAHQSPNGSWDADGFDKQCGELGSGECAGRGEALPEWEPEKFGCDLYYWYHGTAAMERMGGRYWSQWKTALTGALLPSQQKKVDSRGSWDPVGPWGHHGGRIYATSLAVLSLSTASQ